MFAILADYFMKVANKCLSLADIPLWRNLNNSDGGYIAILADFLMKVANKCARLADYSTSDNPKLFEWRI